MLGEWVGVKINISESDMLSLRCQFVIQVNVDLREEVMPRDLTCKSLTYRQYLNHKNHKTS